MTTKTLSPHTFEWDGVTVAGPLKPVECCGRPGCGLPKTHPRHDPAALPPTPPGVADEEARRFGDR